MEDFTFLEQLRLSHNAKIITCFVGSSVLNAFYSNKDIKVFYLNPLNEEYNNEPHLKGYYKHILERAEIENLSYDIDMNALDFSELKNILQTL
jgi:capsular polysaccharide biosynthesis protein